MTLFDARGRLLGRVNAFDAVVLLVVLALLVAAARHSAQFPPRTLARVLVDLPGVTPAMAEAFTHGATAPDGSAHITDAIVVPQDGGLVRVLVAATLRVERLEIGVRYGQQWLSVGAPATLRVGQEAATGTVLSLDAGSGVALHAAGGERLVVAPRVPSADAAALERGAVVQLAPALLLRVEEALAVPRSVNESVLYVRGVVLSLGTNPATMPMPVEPTLVLPAGEVAATWHAAADARLPTLEHVPVLVEVLRAEPGGPPVQAGVVANATGVVLAEIVGSIAVDRGGVCHRDPTVPGIDHATVVLAAARFADSGLEFHGAPLVPGVGLDLPFPGIAGATAASVPRAIGPEVTLGATLQASNVSEPVAAGVARGAWEASIDGGAGLVVEGVDRRAHGTLQDLRLQVLLRADQGPTFKGRELVRGACFPVALGTEVIEAVVVQLEAVS